MAALTQQKPSSIEAALPIEAVPAVTRGRLPLLAFVADADSEASLRASLSEIEIEQAVIQRGGLAAAIRHLASERSPDTLVVDISGVELPVPLVHQLAEVCEPGVTVIALGDQNDVELYRDLMRSGISEYIVKPVTRAALAKALHPSAPVRDGLPIEHKLGTMVAVIGARGGVGATTVATNLAWYLAERQKRRVGIVDLDLQTGDCALSLNLKPTAGLREALANPLRVDPVFLERAMAAHGERLFVLGSEEPLSSEVEVTAEAVEKVITVLRSLVHYVVVDVPRIPSRAYRRALHMADLRIIVADQTLHAVRDALRLRAELGKGDAEHWNLFVLNRAGEGGRHAVSLDEIHALSDMRAKSVIPYHPRLFARAAGKARMAAADRSGVAEAIGALALEISGRLPERRRWWSFGR